MDDLHKQEIQSWPIETSLMVRVSIHPWRKFEPPFSVEHRKWDFTMELAGFFLCLVGIREYLNLVL